MGWLVDGMNVIGAVPDGWWRDRTGAMTRLLAALGPFAATQAPVELFLDGRARDLGEPPDGVTIEWAPARKANAADDRLVHRVRQLPDPADWFLVTSDRGLIDRVAATGIEVLGARAFRQRIGF